MAARLSHRRIDKPLLTRSCVQHRMSRAAQRCNTGSQHGIGLESTRRHQLLCHASLEGLTAKNALSLRQCWV